MTLSKIFRLFLVLICLALGIMGIMVLKDSQGHLPGPQAFGLILGCVATLAVAVIVCLQTIMSKEVAKAPLNSADPKPTPKPIAPKPAPTTAPSPVPLPAPAKRAPAKKLPPEPTTMPKKRYEWIARRFFFLFWDILDFGLIPERHVEEYVYYLSRFEKDFNSTMSDAIENRWQMEHAITDRIDSAGERIYDYVARTPWILAIPYIFCFAFATWNLLEGRRDDRLLTIIFLTFFGAVGGLVLCVFTVGLPVAIGFFLHEAVGIISDCYFGFMAERLKR